MNSEVNPPAPRPNALHVARILFSAAGILLSVWFLIQGPRGESQVRIDEAKRHAAALENASEAPYLKDRARRIDGVVTDSERRPVKAQARIWDTQQLARELVKLSGRGADRFLDWAPPPESTVSNDDQGKFTVAQPAIGNKTVIINAKNFMPLRRSDVIVRDGIGAWSAGGTVKPRERSMVAADGFEGLLEIRAIYRGWWPDAETQTIKGGDTFALEKRDPDGYPGILAIRRSGEPVRFVRREHGAGPDPGPVLFSDFKPWTPGAGDIAGVPDLIRSSAAALSCVVGTGQVRTPPAKPEGEAGIAVVAAEAGFSSVTLRLADGTEYGMFSDEFGEAVFRNIPIGFHTAVTTIPGEGASRRKGIQIWAGCVSRVEFFRADRSVEIEKQSSVILGFLTFGGRAAKGFVFCQSAMQQFSIQRSEPDDQGFFRFDGLRPGGMYDLVFSGAEEDVNVRHVHHVVIPDDLAKREVRVDLELNGRTLLVNLPDSATGNESLVAVPVESGKGWTIELKGRKKVELHEIESGTYRLELRTGATKTMVTTQFVIDSPKREIAPTDWAKP